MAVNISGLISVIIFYVMILLVGLWAARKKKKTTDEGHLESEDVMLAGRNIGLLVGSFTMTRNITMLNIVLLVGSFTMTGDITII